MKFSIIVPIYNVEKYLKQCIESIINQSIDKTEYEIILVNDGSTDNSLNICLEYGDKYENIRIIDKKNGGLSDARNEGLRNSVGEYCVFLDSDDYWIDADFLANISEKIANYDLIVFNSQKYYEENNTFSKARFYSSSNNEIVKCNKDEIIDKGIYRACAWDKVIKRSILIQNDLFFPVGTLSEDMLWGGKLIEDISIVGLYENVVHIYRQRNNSISKTVTSKHIEDMIEQIEDGIKTDNSIVLKYFAFEYAVLIVNSYLASDDQIYHIKQMSRILDVSMNKKVKLIRIVYKLFGFKILRLALRIYYR